MALRIQKSWALLGAPKTAGEHTAPRGVGIISVSQDDLVQIEKLGEQAKVVLEAVEGDGFLPRWKIVEIK